MYVYPFLEKRNLNDLNMKNHKLYSIWDKVPVNYYQKGIKKNLFQKFWHGIKINLARSILKEIEFKNCLDIGCASGFMINEISRFFPGKKYHGIDIYDKAIYHAKKTYPHIKFNIASADKLPFKKNGFDLILFYETIEHVEDPKKTLKEIMRVLHNKGTLILTMDSGSLLFRIVWLIWEKTSGKVWQGAHLHPFTHRELEQIIKQARFKIKQKIFSHLGMEVTFILKK